MVTSCWQCAKGCDMGRYDDLADLAQALCIFALLCGFAACAVVIGYAIAGVLPALGAWIESGAWAR